MLEGPRTDRAPRDPAFALTGSHIVVCVAGGIAAYKAAELVRMLDKAGANVHVAMTARAQKFISPMTFQALTRRPVFTDLFSLTEEASIGHIQLADRADLVIVAPATANSIARLANGMADDAVSAMVLATRAPVLIAPSMNVNMWNHPLTRENLAKLVAIAKYKVVGPGDGFLACRWTGPGRLAEPEDIVEAASTLLSTQDLAGKKLVVSAGPTYEAIDPVRFVGNRSSGKMGIALAAAAKRRGAEVTLILGPSAVPPPIGVTTSHVETAAQLQWALENAGKGADAIIMTAAVADYRPAREAKEKLKRGELGQKTSIELVANPDLLAELGKARKGNTPLLVGFAAETEDVLANARKKLVSKQCDLIVANDVSEPNAGFAVDTNHVQLVDHDEVIDVPPAPKSEVAHRILDKIVMMFGEQGAPRAKAAKAKASKPSPKAAKTSAKSAKAKKR
jgi:phosphopantothenoylcysteine decarboxylase/phosphopantothenate--cysteine ligase